MRRSGRSRVIKARSSNFPDLIATASSSSDSSLNIPKCEVSSHNASNSHVGNNIIKFESELLAQTENNEIVTLLPAFFFSQSSHHSGVQNIDGKSKTVHWVVKEMPFNIQLRRIEDLNNIQNQNSQIDTCSLKAENKPFSWHDVNISVELCYSNTREIVRATHGSCIQYSTSFFGKPTHHSQRNLSKEKQRQTITLPNENGLEPSTYSASLDGIEISIKIACLSSQKQSDFLLKVSLDYQGNQYPCWWSQDIHCVSKLEQVRKVQTLQTQPSKISQVAKQSKSSVSVSKNNSIVSSNTSDSAHKLRQGIPSLEDEEIDQEDDLESNKYTKKKRASGEEVFEMMSKIRQGMQEQSELLSQISDHSLKNKETSNKNASNLKKRKAPTSYCGINANATPNTTSSASSNASSDPAITSLATSTGSTSNHSSSNITVATRSSSRLASKQFLSEKQAALEADSIISSSRNTRNASKSAIDQCQSDDNCLVDSRTIPEAKRFKYEECPISLTQTQHDTFNPYLDSKAQNSVDNHIANDQSNKEIMLSTCEFQADLGAFLSQFESLGKEEGKDVLKSFFSFRPEMTNLAKSFLMATETQNTTESSVKYDDTHHREEHQLLNDTSLGVGDHHLASSEFAPICLSSSSSSLYTFHNHLDIQTDPRYAEHSLSECPQTSSCWQDTNHTCTSSPHNFTASFYPNQEYLSPNSIDDSQLSWQQSPFSSSWDDEETIEENDSDNIDYYSFFSHGNGYNLQSAPFYH